MDIQGFELPCGQVNNPGINNGTHIRTIEWKHMMPKKLLGNLTGTVLTKEIPYSPSDPNAYEYSFPDEVNRILYKKTRNAQNLFRSC